MLHKRVVPQYTFNDKSLESTRQREGKEAELQKGDVVLVQELVGFIRRRRAWWGCNPGTKIMTGGFAAESCRDS